MNNHPSRRGLLAGATAATVGALTGRAASAAPETRRPNPDVRFRYCLNTATIRGQINAQKLGIVRQVELAGKAGYDAIEPWMSHLHDYVKAGGDLKDLNKRVRDAGLTVESAIGFAHWIVDDDTQRAKGLEDAKRDMDVVAQIGGKRIAAPPAGRTRQPIEMLKAAERYRALLEVGDQTGVAPQVEVWGFSKALSRLSESTAVAIEAGHPKACVLADVYHIYRGGSSFTGLGLLGPDAIHVLHMNDYPADPPREQISDAHRVWPGDGIAPLSDMLRTLARHGGVTVLSLELFNRDYWKLDASKATTVGLAKMKAAVKKAMGQ